MPENEDKNRPLTEEEQEEFANEIGESMGIEPVEGDVAPALGFENRRVKRYVDVEGGGITAEYYTPEEEGRIKNLRVLKEELADLDLEGEMKQGIIDGTRGIPTDGDMKRKVGEIM